MNHMTRTHVGDIVDESTRALLVAVERVTCIDSTCCGFRRSGSRKCNRCNQTTSTRPPAVGDIMPGTGTSGTPLGAQNADSDTATPTTSTDSTDVDTQHDLPRRTLPRDFVRRIRVLLAHTLLRIPKSCRLRMLCITVFCWLGLAFGSPLYSSLEKGRSKLLLASVTERTAAADEVARRLDLWENDQLEALLQRVEQQVITMRRGRTRKGKQAPLQAGRRGNKNKLNDRGGSLPQSHL